MAACQMSFKEMTRLQKANLGGRESSLEHLLVLLIAQGLQTPQDHPQALHQHLLLTHQEMQCLCLLCHTMVVPQSLCLCLALMVWAPLHQLKMNWLIWTGLWMVEPWMIEPWMTMWTLSFHMILQILEIKLVNLEMSAKVSHFRSSSLFQQVQVKWNVATSHQMENCLQLVGMIRKLQCGVQSLLT
uniref:Uncharacterized protein MANES_16G063800 n=2 Tax=Rhizophora mucronata TaxID=61149 RepID=A0A2P2LFS2_RHIMU